MTAGHSTFLQLPTGVIKLAVQEYLNKRLLPAARVHVSDMNPVPDTDTLFEFTLEDEE